MKTLELEITQIAHELEKLKLKTAEEREIILKRADKEIPREYSSQAGQMVLDLCNDETFCELSGISYSNLNQEDIRLIRTALASYLLELNKN